MIAPAATQAAPPAHTSHASGSDTDVRCLIFAMNMAASQDQSQKTVGFLGLTYYLGRLDAGSNRGDLEARIEGQIAAMKGQNVVAVAQQCGETLQGRMKVITSVGQQLQQKFGGQVPGAAPSQRPAPSQPMVLKPIPSPQTH